MKINRYYIVVFVLSLLLMPSMAEGQNAVNARWVYKNVNVSRSKDGAQMILSLDIEPQEKSLGTKEVVMLSPSFVSADGTQRLGLGSYVVAGAMRLKALKRSAALGNALPEGVVMEQVKSLKEVAKSPIHVEKEVPFEYWMSSGQIHISERAWGCAQCEAYSVEGVEYSAEISLFSPEDYRYYDYEPFKVEEKSYEEEFVSYLRFMVARSELRRDFEDNARELNRIDDFVRKALRLSDDGATIDRVYIMGYASPEGDFGKNLALSQDRSETISKMTERHFPELRKTAKFEVKGVGEDWSGLKDILLEKTPAYSSEVVEIINRCETDKEREAEIKALQEGQVYKDMLENIYPMLRRTVFKMKYKVRPYTTEELPGIYARKPELLSHWELHELAQNYYVAKGIKPTEVYATAYRLYPNEREAALNYATALLKYNGEASKALEVLETLTSDGEVLFLKAIAVNMQGDLVKAEALLRQSAQAGNKDATAALR